MITPDPADLAAALGREVSSYDVSAIDPGLRLHPITGGVYRVRTDRSALVIKVIRLSQETTRNGLWGGSDDVTHRNYWKREWLAFDSGLLDALPGRLRAPRTLLTTEVSADECWIWMQDVHGRTGSALRLDDFDAVGFALGSTQGAFASGVTPLPDHDWLSRDWLRSWVDLCARFIPPLGDDARWRDERLAPFQPLRGRIASLWESRADLLAIADEAPKTLTHWDFWPTNVYVDDDPTVTAIDWSQIGIGGVAHDLDQVTLDTVWMQVRPDELLEVMEAHVLPPYRSGLRAGGFDVSPSDLQRWYAAAASARYAWMGGGQADVVADPTELAAQEHRFGRDYAAVAASKARVVAHAVALGEWVLDRS